jgi:hypothetical protein
MTWDLTIEQKDKFLELMHDMGAHSMFYLNDMTKRLSECGIARLYDVAMVRQPIKQSCRHPRRPLHVTIK